jgi:Holliday junction resolvase-like predicted endonuclease
VLDRRLQTPAGEVDLLAVDPGGVLVVVEVKTGRVPAGVREAALPDPLLRPARRVDRAALARGWGAARWLGRALGAGGGARLDLIEVLVAKGPRGPLSGAPRVRLVHHRAPREPPITLRGLRPPTGP